MCGIAGTARRTGQIDETWLEAASEQLKHRGPDAAGMWISPDGRIGMAHRRLAIIDLSPNGRQPMKNPTGSVVIVFNGEIYNYKELKHELSRKGYTFVSQSDTEVLLIAYTEWGPDCVSRLNGMFSFALFDRCRDTIMLARDRAGEKPLYYRLENDVLQFASELKGLFADRSLSRYIDPLALECYLAFGYVPGEQCIIRGLKKLPPAHLLEFNISSGRSSVRCYWEVPCPTFGTKSACDIDSLLTQFEKLLEDAVRRQLISDVPVGILLSGGVDSSLVTAMAARVVSRPMTYCVRFRGFGRFDEAEPARLIASHFGTNHIELEAGECGTEILPMLARQFDEPIIDSSIIPTFLVTRLIRKHCKVALGGDGGDELFGGYHHYSQLLWLEKYSKFVPDIVRSLVASTGTTFLPLGFKGRNWLQAFDSDFSQLLPPVNGHFDLAFRRRLFPTYFGPAAEEIWRARVVDVPNLLDRATKTDFLNYLPEDILVKVDRASMANSLEMRAPFLDHRIVEFAFRRIPAALKATSRAKKIFLKRFTQRILPASFDRRRKQGFSIPLAAWLRNGPWLRCFEQILLQPADGLPQREAVRHLLQSHVQRKANNSERLFGLVMLELWRREYKVVYSVGADA